jgi:hypothetical protein
MNIHQYHREDTPRKAGVDACTKCGQHTYVSPLHGDRGGPLFCFMCAGAWHAEHAPRRRARRVVIKAMKAYEAAGGSLFDKDFDEIKLAAGGLFVFREADDVGDDFSDLTAELLDATIALTHPDRHPVERKAEATRITQELQALRPFVFPAPEPEPPPKPSTDDGLFSKSHDELSKLSRLTYPCDDCRDTIPTFYCDPCKAQHEKKWQEEHEREEKERQQKNERQRELYRQHNMFRTRRHRCASCDKRFESKRSDAKYCSAACRQRAYVKRDGKASNNKPLGKNDIERAIKILFTTKPDSAFITDDLCEHVYCLEYGQTERKHRAAVLPIAKKIICEQFETWDWFQPHFSNFGLIFWNRVSLISTAMSNLVGLERYNSEEKLKAAISPGGDRHSEVVKGGRWWIAWQKDVAYFKKRRTK